MRALFFLLFTICLYSIQAQNVADFRLLNDNARIMCYTESAAGTPIKNTKLQFINDSECSGNCWYVWSFGETDDQRIVQDASMQEYTYTKDGRFHVSLSLVNTETIPDTIRLRPVSRIEYTGNINDSAQIDITYTAIDGEVRTLPVLIPQEDFNSQVMFNFITVYSPLVSGNSFDYEIIDPSSQQQKAPIQSFWYTFNVNTQNFRSHVPNYWKYYWTVHFTNEFGEPTTLATSHITDSLVFNYLFPKEHFNPGYRVSLKIALDSLRFSADRTFEYYNLQNCVATQDIILPVTDHFFTEDTRVEVKTNKRSALVPNVFTPGGNDENEVFYFHTNGVDVFTVHIYNSWGNLVYSEEAHTISWTGNDNAGRKCPSGTYYYVISSASSDKRHESAGHIHLFRQD